MAITILITVPIKKLISGVRQIASDNLATTIEVSTRYKIEELADIFNWMTARLRELIRGIKSTLEIIERFNEIKDNVN